MFFVPRPLSRLCVRLSVALVGLALAGPVAAEEDCESALIVAEKSYQLGLFEDVPGQLAPCMQGQSSRAESVNATALLAKTYIAMDDMEKARDAVADLLRLEPSFESATPPRLAALLREVRSSESELQVASVSKTSESLREAPATVVVIGAAEIERRGYLDLEQLLHDLAGFDVSRGNGQTYSTFYQRGFRSNDNDRILLLLDGVEQNDIATGVAHLSRQYPISAVERVEVVYGPASTIYGANAYSGVINIITKPPQAFLAPGKLFGAWVEAVDGSFGSRATELNLAGLDKSGSVAWSVSGRLFRSDERDLSGLPGWQPDFSRVSYQDRLRLEGIDALLLCGFDNDCPDADAEDALFTVVRDELGGVQAVHANAAGAALARELDEGLGLRFSDPTEDWSLAAKLRLANLTVGLEAWSLEEGTAPWYNGDERARHAPATWATEHRSFFVKYGRSLGKSLSLSLFTRYRQSNLDPKRSARREILTYANGGLTLRELVVGCTVGNPGVFQEPYCQSRTEEDEDPRQLATQSAAELTLVYAPQRKFTLVGGVDLKKADIQTRQEVRIDTPFGGFVVGSGDQVVDHTDVGVYAQASYKPLADLSLVAGGRVDYNEQTSPDFPNVGFGTLFSPRLAVVYLPGRYAFKAIYSEAFKDPSDFEKLSATGKRVANPELRQERSRSVEVSAGWHPEGRGSVELAAYRTRYEDLVALGHTCLVGLLIESAPLFASCPAGYFPELVF